LVVIRNEIVRVVLARCAESTPENEKRTKRQNREVVKKRNRTAVSNSSRLDRQHHTVEKERAEKEYVADGDCIVTVFCTCNHLAVVWFTAFFLCCTIVLCKLTSHCRQDTQSRAKTNVTS